MSVVSPATKTARHAQIAAILASPVVRTLEELAVTTPGPLPATDVIVWSLSG